MARIWREPSEKTRTRRLFTEQPSQSNKSMEMIMSTTFSTPAPAQGIVGQSRVSGLVASLKRWWVAYLTRRIERAAIVQLSSMRDRELKDIGLARSEIPYAVMGMAGDRPLRRYC
jgi:uncharacterized protein YjiS (DUF1127 family)